MNFLSIAQTFLSRAPKNQMVNESWSNNAYNAVMNGDSKTGNEIANNICKSMGFNSQQELLQAYLNNMQK